MKHVLLLHNPTAGKETHGEDYLTNMIATAGYSCRYQSLKEKGWKKDIEKAGIIAVAGGDGTVRKVVKALLKTGAGKLPLIGVLPMGTANNISKTLNAATTPEQIIAGWEKERIKRYDVAWLAGAAEKHFFIEGLGFGVFPALVRAMKTADEALADQPEQRIRTALELLQGIIGKYTARHCRLEIDGVDYSGEYLLVEVMNICSVGPNLSLSPSCDPGDGLLHVVPVPAGGRQQLTDYITSRLKDTEQAAQFKVIQGKHVRLQTDEHSIHIDDKLIKNIAGQMLDITLEAGRLQFLV